MSKEEFGRNTASPRRARRHADIEDDEEFEPITDSEMEDQHHAMEDAAHHTHTHMRDINLNDTPDKPRRKIKKTNSRSTRRTQSRSTSDLDEEEREVDNLIKNNPLPSSQQQQSAHHTPKKYDNISGPRKSRRPRSNKIAVTELLAAPDSDDESYDSSYYSDLDSTDEKKDAAIDPAKRTAEIREGIRTGALFLVGLVALGVIIVYLHFIWVPLVLSRFLVYLFQPLVNLLIGAQKWPFIRRRVRLPRALAVLTVFLLILGVLALLVLAVFLSVKQIVSNSDAYMDELDRWHQKIIDFAYRLGYNDQDIANLMPDIDWGGYAVEIVKKLGELIPELVVVVLFVVYMLLDFDAFSKKTELRRNIDNKVRKYIMVHSLIALVMGVGTWAILEVLSIPLAIFFGLLAFLLEYIPNVGAVLAVVLPLPLVVLSPNVGWVRLALVILIPAAMHFIIGQVLEPRILGHVLHLPALTILVSLMFWGYVWGIIGAVLSVPLTAAILIVLASIDHPTTQFLAHFLTNLACD